MAKYSYEFKKEIVTAYIQGEGGKKYLATKYGVKSPQDIMKWVNAYKEFGDDGIMRTRKNKKYTFEFKLSVVELYLTTKIKNDDLFTRSTTNVLCQKRSQSSISSDSRRRKMGQSKGSQGHLRSDTRNRLVCTTTGSMQTHT